jgi:hypothetical protein
VTGAGLKQLREDLGEAIGRPVSVGDMAKLCGLSPETGPETIAEWEVGAVPNGPVAAMFSICSGASASPDIAANLYHMRARTQDTLAHRATG